MLVGSYHGVICASYLIDFAIKKKVSRSGVLLIENIQNLEKYDLILNVV